MSGAKDKLSMTISIFAACLLAALTGYCMITVVSTLEKPPLGMTFHVIAGNLLLFSSIIIICLELKKIIYRKKKKKGSPVFFLDADKKARQNNPLH